MEITDSVSTECVHIYSIVMLTASEHIEEEQFILKMILKYSFF